MRLLLAMVMNVVICAVFLLFSKNMSYKLIDRKLLRAVLISVIFSFLGIINIYLIDIHLSIWVRIMLIVLNLTVIVGTVGIYKKNWKLAFITFFSILLNIGFDNNIDKNSVMPIVIFITYVRSILCLELFWDGIIGIYVYYRKVNTESINMQDE